MIALAALGITLPPAVAYVLAIWLQRVGPAADRCTTLEAHVVALETEQAALREECRIARHDLDRLANQRFGE